ncbi:MAG: hypothetical protein ABW006_12900 [Hyphomicrobium sp.]
MQVAILSKMGDAGKIFFDLAQNRDGSRAFDVRQFISRGSFYSRRRLLGGDNDNRRILLSRVMFFSIELVRSCIGLQQLELVELATVTISYEQRSQECTQLQAGNQAGGLKARSNT